jgi:hypothetical protein
MDCGAYEAVEAERPSTSAEIPDAERQCIVDTETFPNFTMIGLRLQEPGKRRASTTGR